MAEPSTSFITVVALLVKEIFQFLRERIQARKDEKAAETKTAADQAIEDLKQMMISTRSEMNEIKALMPGLKETMDRRRDEGIEFARDRCAKLEDDVLSRVFDSELRATRAAENSNNALEDIYAWLERKHEIDGSESPRRRTRTDRDSSGQDPA